MQKGEQNAPVGRPVGRPTHVPGRPARSTGTNLELAHVSRSTDSRPLLCHGRPGHACARRAHRSTGRSTGSVHRSTGRSTGFCPGLLQCPFDFRSLCYLPLSPLSPLYLHFYLKKISHKILSHTTF